MLDRSKLLGCFSGVNVCVNTRHSVPHWRNLESILAHLNGVVTDDNLTWPISFIPLTWLLRNKVVTEATFGQIKLRCALNIVQKPFLTHICDCLIVNICMTGGLLQLRSCLEWILENASFHANASRLTFLFEPIVINLNIYHLWLFWINRICLAIQMVLQDVFHFWTFVNHDTFLLPLGWHRGSQAFWLRRYSTRSLGVFSGHVRVIMLKTFLPESLQAIILKFLLLFDLQFFLFSFLFCLYLFLLFDGSSLGPTHFFKLILEELGILCFLFSFKLNDIYCLKPLGFLVR